MRAGWISHRTIVARAAALLVAMLLLIRLADSLGAGEPLPGAETPPGLLPKELLENFASLRRLTPMNDAWGANAASVTVQRLPPVRSATHYNPAWRPRADVATRAPLGSPSFVDTGFDPRGAPGLAAAPVRQPAGSGLLPSIPVEPTEGHVYEPIFRPFPEMFSVDTEAPWTTRLETIRFDAPPRLEDAAQNAWRR